MRESVVSVSLFRLLLVVGQCAQPAQRKSEAGTAFLFARRASATNVRSFRPLLDVGFYSVHTVRCECGARTCGFFLKRLEEAERHALVEVREGIHGTQVTRTGGESVARTQLECREGTACTKATATTRRTCECALSTCKNVGTIYESVRGKYFLRESFGSTQTRRSMFSACRTFFCV